MSELTPCQTPGCTSRINVAVMERDLCGLCSRDLPRSAKSRMTATTLARHHHHDERKTT